MTLISYSNNMEALVDVIRFYIILIGAFITKWHEHFQDVLGVLKRGETGSQTTVK
jgi:hypothetical protein